MGYRDYALTFSKSQAVTADANSSNSIDLGAAHPAIDRGKPLAVSIIIEAVTTAGTGIEFQLVHNSSTGPTTTVILCKWIILAADLAAGTELVLPLPQGVEIDRYLILYYNITAGTESYTISAYLTNMPIHQSSH